MTEHTPKDQASEFKDGKVINIKNERWKIKRPAAQTEMKESVVEWDCPGSRAPGA